MLETKPLLAWCFPYETPAPIFLLPSPFLLSILYYSHGSCSSLQMSGMFSSEQHKFSRLTGKAKRKKRKNQTPNRDYLVLFTSWKQAAGSAGLAPFKPLCSHRKRTKRLSRSPHPAPWGVVHLRPRVSQRCQGRVSTPTPRQQTGTAPRQQQLSRGERSDQQFRGAEEHVWLHRSCASRASTCLARPSTCLARPTPRARESRPPG